MASEVGNTGVAMQLPVANQQSGHSSKPVDKDVAVTRKGADSAASSAQRLDEQGMRDLAQQLESKAEQIIQARQIDKGLQFTVDSDTDRTVIKVIDRETDELIRQIPDEEALRISQHVEEYLESGDLLNVQA